MSNAPNTSPVPAPAQTASAPIRLRPGFLTWTSLAMVAGLITGLTLYLWPQWHHNPDLQHGWFTPLIFVLLIHEARTRGTQRYLQPSRLLNGLIAAVLLSGLVLLAAGGLYMAALEWTHALVATMVTSAVCALLVAAWTSFAFSSVRLVPFNWPAGVAIFLWLLSSPLPPGTYGTLTNGLQAGVTSAVLSGLHFLGIAAVQHGNIIQLTNVSVGIEEACSGVRSLISCVYAGFFISATLVWRPSARVWVIALAAPLAVVMNLLRSFTLTLLAHFGVDITGAWHDVTGYSIIVVTTALLAGLAIYLERRTPDASKREESTTNPLICGKPRNSQRLVASGLTLAIGLAVLIVINTRPASNSGRPALDLAALLPTSFDGWVASPNSELTQFSAQLQTSHLAQTTYTRQTPRGPLEITVYLAYWPVGATPVSQVATHTPDACWPGSGWELKPLLTPRVPLTISGRQIDDAEYRQFTQAGFLQHVWYWHLYNGRVIHPEGARSPRQLLLLAFKYGFHREGEQLFVRVSSNQPWETIATEPLLQEIFARLTKSGL